MKNTIQQVGAALCRDRSKRNRPAEDSGFASNSSPSRRKAAPTVFRRSSAFTLVELMVSIAVMAILAGILFTAFNQSQNAPRLDTAQMILSQAFANARSQAILKQSRARLIIYNSEPTNQEEADKFLRYFGVIVETGAGTDQWETALQGEFLPEGIYFIPETSAESLNWNENRPSSKHNGQTMSLTFPSLEAQTIGTGPEWSYYEFKSTGRMSGLTNKLVLAQGSIRDLKPEFPETAALLGMVFNGYGLQFPLDEEEAL